MPDGFDATSDSYATWLVDQLELFDEPVDLVGHDWGGGHVMRAATRRPDLVRRMVTDIAGTGDPEYVWHEMAQLWQQPGAGEAFFEGMTGIPAAKRIENFVAAGMSPEGASACVDGSGPEMAVCVLALYRSAVQPKMTEWADEYAELSERPPTLVVIALDDDYTGGEILARRTAERWGAEVAVLDGLGHWWMLQDPARSAAMLRNFLSA